MSTYAGKLKSNKSITILDAAEKAGYGIVSIVCHNVEEITATAGAAEARESPVMLLLFSWALTQFKSRLVGFAADVCKSASVPTSLHLDRSLGVGLARHAASLPFSSVVVNTGRYEKGENPKSTKEESLRESGNIHGRYGPAGPRAWLGFDHFGTHQESGRRQMKIVLRGANAFDRGLFRQCIKGKISKAKT
ncbi:hypothetical protein B0O99DRAFT_517739 [Bisporella sp. PMI_857]|nr:hypothetical protein B0O99DRAFT_517739 [Bisporella sp. PMI_857]